MNFEEIARRLDARKSGDSYKAICKAHEDRTPSLSIRKGRNGRTLVKCHAGCELDAVLAAVGLTKRDLFDDSLRLPAAIAAPTKPAKEKAPPAFDWQQSVDAFTEKHLERLSDWRGYSGRFCSWLHNRGLVGSYKDCIAFPVHDKDGRIVAAHCRSKSGKWFYKPGTPVQPFIIGDLKTAKQVHSFESQWDMFALMDRTELYLDPSVAFIATRGAEHAKVIKGLLREGLSVCAWPQNDELKNGKRAGDEWLKKLARHADVPVSKALVPPLHKDMNDWCLAGATAEDIYGSFFRNELVEVPKLPDLGTLLDDISEYLLRFVIFSSDAQPIVLALWIAHAWAIDAFDVTPYPNIFSPEKRSGKTQLLECLSHIVPKPWLTLSPSEAVLYRKTEKDGPTLLLDESDALFLKSGSDRQEYVRAYLNSGYRRGLVVTRCMGANFQPVDFKTFCPKVIAGIGGLPDTVADRSIPIRLIRKSRGENVERLRERDVKVLVQPTVDALKAWSSREDVIQSLRGSRPAEIYELSDRQMDMSEPLLAIAEMAGGDWPELTHAALVKLSTSENDDEALGIKVLTAIRDVFNPVDQDDNPQEPLERIPSKELLEGMVDLQTDAPWAQWWEDDLRNQNVKGPAARLARLLKPFRIKAHVIKLDANSTARGYLRKDFEDAWNRYCPSPPKKDVTT
jgi:hypothetical protein